MVWRVRSARYTLAALMAGVALQARAEVLEEIIVTAQKREQSLQDFLALTGHLLTFRCYA